MINLVEVGRSGELKDGTVKEVLVMGRAVLLAKISDSYFISNNRCPHMKGKLSQGKLEGTVVTCPRHGSQIDLRTGRVVRWLKGSRLVSMVGKTLKSPRLLATHNVKVEDDRTWIEI